MATPKQNSVYKINILNIENKVESIHVFYGNVYKNNINLEEFVKNEIKLIINGKLFKIK
jgi:PhoPQ-activated pathogenicity-related protein